MLHVGELNVKTNKKGLSLTKFGDLNCSVPGCGRPDSQNHLTRCGGNWSSVPREEITFNEELG